IVPCHSGTGPPSHAGHGCSGKTTSTSPTSRLRNPKYCTLFRTCFTDRPNCSAMSVAFAVWYCSIKNRTSSSVQSFLTSSPASTTFRVRSRKPHTAANQTRVSTAPRYRPSSALPSCARLSVGSVRLSPHPAPWLVSTSPGLLRVLGGGGSCDQPPLALEILYSPASHIKVGWV